MEEIIINIKKDINHAVQEYQRNFKEVLGLSFLSILFSILIMKISMYGGYLTLAIGMLAVMLLMSQSYIIFNSILSGQGLKPKKELQIAGMKSFLKLLAVGTPIGTIALLLMGFLGLFMGSGFNIIVGNMSLFGYIKELIFLSPMISISFVVTLFFFAPIYGLLHLITFKEKGLIEAKDMIVDNITSNNNEEKIVVSLILCMTIMMPLLFLSSNVILFLLYSSITLPFITIYNHLIYKDVFLVAY